MNIEAMKQALEALKFCQARTFIPNNQRANAIIALRQAIAEAEEQEPVAWNGWVLREVYFEDGIPCTHREPPKREWVGLTDEEIQDSSWQHFVTNQWPTVHMVVRELEAKLRRRNT